MDLEKLDHSLMLDGNAVAGDLMEIFGAEMTGEPVECRDCGRVQMVGTLTAYARGPGVVLRCSGCDAIMLCIVTTPRGNCVDVRWILAS